MAKSHQICGAVVARPKPHRHGRVHQPSPADEPATRHPVGERPGGGARGSPSQRAAAPRSGTAPGPESPTLPARSSRNISLELPSVNRKDNPHQIPKRTAEAFLGESRRTADLVSVRLLHQKRQHADGCQRGHRRDHGIDAVLRRSKRPRPESSMARSAPARSPGRRSRRGDPPPDGSRTPGPGCPGRRCRRSWRRAARPASLCLSDRRSAVRRPATEHRGGQHRTGDRGQRVAGEHQRLAAGQPIGSRPEYSFSRLAMLSTSPSIRPSAAGLAPSTPVKNSGSSG